MCLAEIEHCRPYFIGLLGERYGWVPEEIPPELLEAQPWLTDHRKQSVTALEILHGAMALYREKERLCRELGNPEGLPVSLANQAEMLSSARGRRREARRLADEALAIATRHGYQRLVPEIECIRDSIPFSEE